MNEFEKNEEKGRWYFEQILKAANITDYEFSEDRYSVWDAKYWTKGKEYLVEIKVRNYSYDRYPDWILELKKYNGLLALSGTALYVNFFDDGYFAIWNLKNINPDLAVKKWCSSTTALSGEYIQKEVVHLNLIDAVLFGQIENESVTTKTFTNDTN